MLFDIMLHGEFDGTVIYHLNVAVPRPIKPHYIKVQGSTLSEQIIQPCQLCILFKFKQNIYLKKLMVFHKIYIIFLLT